jgi:FXSXX-COOH protein
VSGVTNTAGATPEWRSAMIDVSGLSLAELAVAAEAMPEENPALARCLRRLAEDVAGPGEPIAGFNSAL